MNKRVKTLHYALSGMIMVALLAMPFKTNAQAGKANFAGNWTYNAEQSTQPTMPGGGAPGGRHL